MGGLREDARLDDLYADIAAVTGMPFPNLVYRILGEHPERLRSCWSRVRDGLDEVGRDALRARILGPALDAAAAFEDAPRLGADQLETVRSVFDAYDSGNACNAVVVRLLLDGSAGGADPDALPPSGRTVAAGADRLPPMLELHRMAPEAREEVLRLAALVDPSSDVVPSAFRHFAHDAGLLRSLASTLSRAEAEGSLQRVSRTVQAAVTAIVGGWPVAVEPVDDPRTRALLAPFVEVISRMLAVSALSREARR